MKTCTKCLVEKPLSDFCKDKSMSDGLRKKCRPCRTEDGQAWLKSGSAKAHPDWKKGIRRKSDLRVKYGLTPEQEGSLRALQGNACPICQNLLKPGKGEFAVDHSHLTGEVRGILCGRCNRGLGNFVDSPDLLRAATSYLERFVH